MRKDFIFVLQKITIIIEKFEKRNIFKVFFFIFDFFYTEPEPTGEPKGEPEPAGEPKGEPESEPKGEPEGILFNMLLYLCLNFLIFLTKYYPHTYYTKICYRPKYP